MEKEKFALNKLRFKAWTGMLDYKGHKILVMKPQTYMNLSGESVGEAARFYKVPADHVLVISDDVSLPVGKLRIRKKAARRRSQWAEEHHSAPGHRCVSRIKVGGYARPPGPRDDRLGHRQAPGRGGQDPPRCPDRAADAALSVIDEGPDRAMNRFN